MTNNELTAIIYQGTLLQMSTVTDLPPIRRRRRYTQTERRALSDQRMLGSAIALIARQGSSRTTLAQVGETAGYTYGLVGSRFGTKGNLIRAVTRSLQSAFVRRTLDELDGLTGVAALHALIDAYLTQMDSTGRRAMYVLMGEALGPVPEIRSDMAAADENFRENIRKYIEDAVATGTVRADIDAATQATLLLASLRGISLQFFINPSALDVGALSQELKANLDHSLGVRGTTRKPRPDRNQATTAGEGHPSRRS